MSQLGKQELEILQHALGCDRYGQGGMYRNHYVVGPGCSDFDACQRLCALGAMTDAGPQRMCGEMHLFWVTDKGKAIMRSESPAAPVLTRAQKRYRAFLRADFGLTFGQWLKSGWAKEWERV